ncbi:hypothetical protein GCM10027168_66370 [Streptomyces capparidis]
MPESNDFGARLAEIRKRRLLSQRQLAEASGVSVSLIRKIEQGEVSDPRMETARRLAAALRVPTTSLLRRADPAPGPAPEPWLPLQRAVEQPAVQPDEEPTLDGLTEGLRAVREAYFDKRMRDAVALLVPLLRDADALDGEPEARAVRAHLLQIAGSTLTQARAFAAAETALRRALDDAPDRLRAASVITTWAWLLVRQGRMDEARDMAVKWADDSEPRLSRATAEELAAWGWLLLQAAAASLRDNRCGEADHMLRLARGAAATTGRISRGEVRLATWGPETVAYKAVERHIIMDRPDEVLAVAERLAKGRPAGGTEWHRHRLDVAKAHLMLRQYGPAVQVLGEVRAEAPEWLAQQRYARDILSGVVGRRRTLTPEMRDLADGVGLPL